MLVLVDTSVWIDFFRRAAKPWKKELVDLMEAEQVAIVPPVVAELLYGAKGETEQARVLDLSYCVTVLPAGLEQWIGAGKLGRALRKEGVTLSIVDCLVAEVAQKNEIPLWTLDADFQELFSRDLLKPHPAMSPPR